jgi:heme-degrading monooxygenase HmoA
MHVSLSIMKPNDGYESETIESMHRFGAAARTQDGLRFVTALKDAGTGELIGLAVWESQAHAHSAGPALMAAVAEDDFESWVAEMRNFDLTEV